MLLKPLYRTLPLVARRGASSQAYVDSLSALKKDLKQAMLSKDQLKKDTIRSLLSAIKNKEIQNAGKEFDEYMLQDIYNSLISQRRDSIAEFTKNGRNDLTDKEAKEMAVLQQYLRMLPVLSAEELNAKALAYLRELKAQQGEMQLPKVLKTIDWKTLPATWRASPSSIKSALVAQFKTVFN